MIRNKPLRKLGDAQMKQMFGKLLVAVISSSATSKYAMPPPVLVSKRTEHDRKTQRSVSRAGEPTPRISLTSRLCKLGDQLQGATEDLQRRIYRRASAKVRIKNKRLSRHHCSFRVAAAVVSRRVRDQHHERRRTSVGRAISCAPPSAWPLQCP